MGNPPVIIKILVMELLCHVGTSGKMGLHRVIYCWLKPESDSYLYFLPVTTYHDGIWKIARIEYFDYQYYAFLVIQKE